MAPYIATCYNSQAIIIRQLDATYCFIILMIGSTCFGHCYVHHQELTTVAVGWKLGAGSLPAPNFQPTATQERDGQVVISTIVVSS